MEQKLSNPLTDPAIYSRLAKMMARDMSRLALSDEQLKDRMQAINGWQKGSVSTLRRYLSGAGDHKITNQTLGLIAKALEWSDDDRNWVLFGESVRELGANTQVQKFLDAFALSATAEEAQLRFESIVSLYLAHHHATSLLSHMIISPIKRSAEYNISILMKVVGRELTTSPNFTISETWSVNVYKAMQIENGDRELGSGPINWLYSLCAA